MKHGRTCIAGKAYLFRSNMHGDDESDKVLKPTETHDPATAGPMADGDPSIEIKDIVLRLQTPPTNPVTRARLRVEQEVPEAQRGPGWDRHWRELEAYAESAGTWSNKPEEQ